MGAYLVQTVGGGVLPIPHHEAARPRPQYVPRLRLRPAVILLRLVLGIDDCNEAGIGSVPEWVVWGVCQQLGGVPGECNTDSVRGNLNQKSKQSSGSKMNCQHNGNMRGCDTFPKMKKTGSHGRLQIALDTGILAEANKFCSSQSCQRCDSSHGYNGHALCKEGANNIGMFLTQQISVGGL